MSTHTAPAPAAAGRVAPPVLNDQLRAEYRMHHSDVLSPYLSSFSDSPSWGTPTGGARTSAEPTCEG